MRKDKGLWLVREELMRAFSHMFSRLEAFMGNYDKKHEKLQFDVLRLSDDVKKLKKKKNA